MDQLTVSGLKPLSILAMARIHDVGTPKIGPHMSPAASMSSRRTGGLLWVLIAATATAAAGTKISPRIVSVPQPQRCLLRDLSAHWPWLLREPPHEAPGRTPSPGAAPGSRVRTDVKMFCWGGMYSSFAGKLSFPRCGRRGPMPARTPWRACPPACNRTGFRTARAP